MWDNKHSFLLIVSIVSIVALIYVVQQPDKRNIERDMLLTKNKILQNRVDELRVTLTKAQQHIIETEKRIEDIKNNSTQTANKHHEKITSIDTIADDSVMSILRARYIRH